MPHKNIIPKDNAAVLEEIRNSEATHVKVAVADIDGVLRGKYLLKDKFFSSVEGSFGFCNVIFGWDSTDVCYDNSSYTGWHSGYPDAQAKIDLSTYRQIPWDNHTPFFLGDFEDGKGNPLSICPRQLLKKVIQKLKVAGFAAKTGIEYEWFNFKETPQSWADKKYTSPEPITPGMFGYSLLRSSLNQPFFAALLSELNQFRIPLEGLHTETGPGVLEAAILYSDPLEAADRGILFKTAVKEIGYRFGIMPSFMAKWSQTLPGCSGHIHQSLWNCDSTGKAGETNVFYDPKDPHKMSALFKSFLAGQLQCLPEILPFCAPTINSYRRLVDGFWAPTQSNWGVDNRTTAFRVIAGNSKSTRLEARITGSDINPYIASAALLAAGLMGIEKNLNLDEKPIIGSAYLNKNTQRLPRTLQEATQKLSDSKIAREILGEVFVNHFVKTREWEWTQFQDSVSQWELKRYFEII
ncbi:MAG: glutamine synthetase [Bdellovibrionales bacterium]|nr:glutamine synthetase [Bdellovibrionales bacterium]